MACQSAAAASRRAALLLLNVSPGYEIFVAPCSPSASVAFVVKPFRRRDTSVPRLRVPPPASESPMPVRSHRMLPLVVAAAALALSLGLAASLPLVDPDEGRNAEVAREMSDSGD